MGLSSHSVENFGRPFVMVDEVVFVVPAASAVDIPPHHFKILFFLDGEIGHEMEDFEGTPLLRAGDIFATPPVATHRYYNPSLSREARVHAVRLFIDPYPFHRRRRRLNKPEASFEDFLVHHFTAPMQLEAGIDADIGATLLALRRESETHAHGFRHRVHSLCTDLMVLTARRRSLRAHRRDERHTRPIVAEAMEFIQKHFHNPDLRLGAIAHHTGKGDEHLSRLFKKETGRSVFDYVRELRIHYAKTLLQDASLSLTTIAGRCGFQSLAFFSRAFKQSAGLAPSVYRRHLDLSLKPAPSPHPR